MKIYHYHVLKGINVLSIALDISLKQLFKGYEARMFGLAAESRMKQNGAEVVIDRVGRPEITNLSLYPFGGVKKIKRLYNEIPVFTDLSRKKALLFTRRLKSNISAFDRLDQDGNLEPKIDWQPRALDRLIDLLLNDYLVIDLDQFCGAGEESYFGIEKSLINGAHEKARGGRTFKDDVMKILYALYIGGPNADVALYETGASKPYQSDGDKELNSDIPYLDKPRHASWLRSPLLMVKLKWLERFKKANQE